MNNTLRRLIDIVLLYDGDIVKFAGDAMIIIWKVDSSASSWLPQDDGLTLEEKKAIAVAKACNCAMDSIKVRTGRQLSSSSLFLLLF